MKKLFLSLVFIVVGVGVAILGNGVLKNAKQSTDWPAVEGKVISSEVERNQKRSNGKSSTTYHAEVLYDYVVEGTTYSGNKVVFGQGGSSNPASARSIVNRYPRAKIVSVFYNPDTPDVSVLEPGATWQSYIMLGLGILFAGIGLLLPFGRMR